MNKFIEKYRTEILLVLIAFFIYFFIGTFVTYYLQTYKFVNVLLDLDTPRVFLDLSSRIGNHYRTTVHPLFIASFQPIVYILKHIFNSPEIASYFLQCLLGSFNVLMIYLILKKIGLDKKKSLLLTIIFGFMSNQIVFTASIETYIFAQFFLMLLWLFTLYNIDKKFTLWKYIFITFLGVMSIAVTLTNFVQFIIACSLLTVFNKKLDKKLINRFVIYGAILFCSFSIAVLLADSQLIVWKSSPNFYVKNVQDFRGHKSEENLYMSMPNKDSVVNQFNVLFGDSFNIASLKWKYNTYLLFNHNIFTKVISILLGILFFVLNILFIIKDKFNFKKNKYYYALFLAFLFNFCFHLIYGNGISFIYTCHYNFIMIILIGYLIKESKLKIFDNNKINIAIVLLLICLSIKNIIRMCIILRPRYIPVEYFSYTPILLLGIDLLLISLIIFRKKYLKLISLLLVILMIFGTHKLLNTKKVEVIDKNDLFKQYEVSLNKYKKQIIDMKNTYNVKYFIEPKEPIGIFYFGMGDRKKIVYKDGKLIDLKTKEIIKEVDYSDELIVPNEYSVLLKDKKDNVYLIEENEDGIFFSKNNDKEKIVESGKEIHLPEYDGMRYSEILKVLHQEVLFNIDGSEPRPNIIGYYKPFYRDAMVATMVLEDTDNVHLIADWVKNLDSIYDYARSSEIKEPDNLGELLYMIGATKVDRDDLVEEVLDEIENIRTEDNMIHGNIDSAEQKYYPTAIALFGEEKLGIKPNLSLGNIDDVYGKLTWYYHNPNMIWAQFIDAPLFPYLGWAQRHYTEHGLVYMLDEIYPLSYEAGTPKPGYKAEPYCFISEFYCENVTHISHLWDASEKYLFLKEQK